jgi:DNA adenine methylase
MAISPFIKWVGGKTQSLGLIRQHYPARARYYIEPFVGGGAVLFDFISAVQNGTVECNKFFINDINLSLMISYSVIRDNLNGLLQKLSDLQQEYRDRRDPDPEVSECSPEQEVMYYTCRREFNDLRASINRLQSPCTDEETATLSALFIFLNKTCFRGLYRECKKGNYNVPFGHYQHVTICDEPLLRAISNAFNQYEITFSCQDFRLFLSEIEVGQNDFVFIDSPYISVVENDKKKGSFVDYSKGGFSADDHDHLANWVILSPAHSLLCNHYKEEYLTKFPTELFDHQVFTARRCIHRSNPLSTAREIMVFKKTSIE